MRFPDFRYSSKCYKAQCDAILVYLYGTPIYFGYLEGWLFVLSKDAFTLALLTYKNVINHEIHTSIHFSINAIVAVSINLKFQMRRFPNEARSNVNSSRCKKMKSVCKWRYFLLQMESTGSEVAFSDARPETGTGKCQGCFPFRYLRKTSGVFGNFRICSCRLWRWISHVPAHASTKPGSDCRYSFSFAIVAW